MGAHTAAGEVAISFRHGNENEAVFLARGHDPIAVAKLPSAESVEPGADRECLLGHEIVVGRAIDAFVELAIEAVVAPDIA